MSRFSLTHLSNQSLKHDFIAIDAREHETRAVWLAHLAEFDARRLYLPAAYPSMYAYCVGEMHLSEETACRRIRVARAARQYPAIFVALAEGRLHLTAVDLLAPYLSPANIDELLAAATHRSKAQIERLLAERFPRLDLPTRLEAVPTAPTGSSPSPSPKGSLVGSPSLETVDLLAGSPSLVTVEPPAGSPSLVTVNAHTPRPRVTPLAPERFALQVTIGRGTHDLLREAQELLGRQVRPGDVAEVLHRALAALVQQLQKRKFAATRRPRHRRRGLTTDSRRIPAEVKRAVWERDGGRCTFVSEKGHRCESRTRLEFDHVLEAARGGLATIGGIRLRCRAHNQYGAECTFGNEFMRHKREAARRAAAEAREKRAAARIAQAETAAASAARGAAANAAREAAAERARELDVIPWLRQLGCRAGEARRAAAHCESIPEASLEERLRAALAFLTPGHRRPRAPRPAFGELPA